MENNENQNIYPNETPNTNPYSGETPGMNQYQTSGGSPFSNQNSYPNTNPYQTQGFYQGESPYNDQGLNQGYQNIPEGYPEYQNVDPNMPPNMGYNQGFIPNGYPNMNGSYNSEPPKKKKGLIIGIIAAAVVIIALVIVLVCFLTNNKEATNEPIDVAESFVTAFKNNDSDGIREILPPDTLNEDDFIETFDDFFETVVTYNITYDSDSETCDVGDLYTDDELEEFKDDIDGTSLGKKSIDGACDITYEVDYTLDMYGATYGARFEIEIITIKVDNTWYLIGANLVDWGDLTEVTTEKITTEEITEVSTENSTEDATETEVTSENSSETDNNTAEKTEKTLYSLIDYDGTVLYTFVEPDGWTVDAEYLDDTDNNQDTLFFLDNDDYDTITISCYASSGIVYFYEEEEGSEESSKQYEVVATGFTTTYNPYGYDIFKFTSESFDDYTYYVAILYDEADSCLCIEFPDYCDALDTLEEVEAFLTDNF